MQEEKVIRIPCSRLSAVVEELESKGYREIMNTDYGEYEEFVFAKYRKLPEPRELVLDIPYFGPTIAVEDEELVDEVVVICEPEEG